MIFRLQTPCADWAPTTIGTQPLPTAVSMDPPLQGTAASLTALYVDESPAQRFPCPRASCARPHKYISCIRKSPQKMARLDATSLISPATSARLLGALPENPACPAPASPAGSLPPLHCYPLFNSESAERLSARSATSPAMRHGPDSDHSTVVYRCNGRREVACSALDGLLEPMSRPGMVLNN